MDKDNRERGGLNVESGGWVGQARVMGENGDNCNWATITFFFREKKVVHFVLGLNLIKKCFLERINKQHLSFHCVQQYLKNSNAWNKDKYFWGRFFICQLAFPSSIHSKSKMDIENSCLGPWNPYMIDITFFTWSLKRMMKWLKLHMGRVLLAWGSVSEPRQPACTHHCIVFPRLGWQIVLSSKNIVEHELYFSVRWLRDTWRVREMFF